jgi:hypothetical protein
VNAQQLVDATRRRLRAGSATEDLLNVLAQPYTPGSGALVFAQPLGQLQNGTRVSAGLNVFHVVAVSSTTTSATVISAVESSNDDPLPAGTVVRVKPRWTDFDILDSLNNDLQDLSSPLNGLFQVASTEFPWNASVRGYDIGDLNLIRVLEVRFQTQGPFKDWPRVLRWRLERNTDTTDFPSGMALRVDSGAFQGRPIQVVYAAPFGALDDLTTDLADTGLPASCYRLPPLGAAIQLQTGVDIDRTRTDTQGNTRRADEVPAQTPGLAIKAIAALRAQWIANEAARLIAAWPVKNRV